MSFGLDTIPGLILITLCYAAMCAKSPYATCRKCQGWGSKIHVSRFSGHLKRGRICRRCRGYGRRLRIGRRLYNAVSHIRHDGTR